MPAPRARASRSSTGPTISAAVRRIPLLLVATLPLYSTAEPAMVEYANESYPAWKKSNEDMDKRYKQLMKEAEQEPKKDSASRLASAKDHWERFRADFCRSMSDTYGGAWSSAHESECRVKLANQFKNIMDDYGW